MWKTFDLYSNMFIKPPHSLQHWFTVPPVCLHSMGLSQSWNKQTLNNILFLNGEYETGWWFETCFIYHPYYGEMIQFDEAHIFQMGGKITTNQERVHQFLEAPWGFSLTWKQRPVPTGHRIRGERLESMKVLPSNLPYDFGIPVTFKAMSCFNIIQYIYIDIMLYHIIEMYVCLYIYIYVHLIFIYT